MRWGRSPPGKLEGIGSAPHLVIHDAAGRVLVERRWEDRSLDHEAFLGEVLSWIETLAGSCSPIGIGHRVVHGGVEFAAPELITQQVLDAPGKLVPLTPLHQPHNLAAIFAAMAARPGVPNVARFDTAFRRTQPPAATRFAIPSAFFEEGVRRYGFHVLSYEYLARTLEQMDPAAAAGRLVAAHLGNGASLCAMAGGRSVDTTWIHRPRRPDDGNALRLYRSRRDPLPPAAKGNEPGRNPVPALQTVRAPRRVGLSGDMREPLASDQSSAGQAVDLFVHRVGREAGARASSLAGLDGLVFTGGIGENSPVIRALVCRRLAWLGVEIDGEANEAGAPKSSTADSRVTVRVIPTDEERMIAMHTVEAVRQNRALEAA